MNLCPVCKTLTIRKSGKIKVNKMTKDGEKILKYQAYRCLSNHFFSEHSSTTKFTNSFIEYVLTNDTLRCIIPNVCK